MFLDFIFPNRCLQCNQIISKDELVCEICVEKIHFTNWKFEDETLLKKKCKLLFPVENAYALMHFGNESLSRKIIHGLKYGNNQNNGTIIAKWISETVIFQKEKPDLIVSVPLHPKKLKKRGYNQLHLFGKEISEFYKITINNQILRRDSYQKAQARKDKMNRQKTEYDFSLTEKIMGKHVLIIDDVYTTGNTISAIAWEILKEPSNKVSVLVMAVDL